MTRRDRPITMMKVTSEGLAPYSHRSGEILSRMKPGTIVEVSVTEPKHHGQLALFWSLADLVAQNNDQFIDARSLVNALLIALRYVEGVRVENGSIIITPMRISDMGHQQFNEFFQRAVVMIIEHVIPGADPDTLLREAAKR